MAKSIPTAVARRLAVRYAGTEGVLALPMIGFAHCSNHYYSSCLRWLQMPIRHISQHLPIAREDQPTHCEEINMYTLLSARLRNMRKLSMLFSVVVFLMLVTPVWAWSGTGHFVTEGSIGYTPSGYTAAPNFRQASTSTNTANSAISSADSADMFVNFDYDTTGRVSTWSTQQTAQPRRSEMRRLHGQFLQLFQS